MTFTAAWSECGRGDSSPRRLAEASQTIRHLLADCSEERTHPPGYVLAMQGDRLGEIFVITSGRVKVVHVHMTGRETLVAVRGAGWLIGASEVLGASPLFSSVIAVTGVTVHVVPALILRQRVQQDVRLSYALLLLLSLDIFDQADSLLTATASTARERVERFLMECAKQAPASAQLASFVQVRLPISRRALATYLHVAPETLCRILAQLEAKGVLRRSRGALYIRPDIQRRLSGTRDA